MAAVFLLVLTTGDLMMMMAEASPQPPRRLLAVSGKPQPGLPAVGDGRVVTPPQVLESALASSGSCKIECFYPILLICLC